jgi:hypothetical protein
MSRNIDQDRTGLFTVVGAPYVPEKHNDSSSHFHEAPDALPPEAGIAALWVIADLVIFGVSLFANGNVGHAVARAVAYLK